MKRFSFSIAISLVVFILAGVCYCQYLFHSFVTREMRRRAGSQNIRVVDQFHSDHDWYGKAEIDQITGKQLLTRYAWKRGFERDALDGKLVPERLQDCSTCFYWVESSPHDRLYHPYRYTVYLLSSDLKVFEAYEEFGG